MKYKFEIKEEFELNGEELKIISGSIHYFRSMPSTWEDKLIKLKALGANTVETYVPWNLHEEQEGEWNLSRNLDLPYFLELATKHDFLIILRFGPYICAEHDYGGFPWWLNNKEGIKLRCDNEQYLVEVDKYVQKIVETIRPYLNSNGGNIILGQLENEYGSYGNDKIYLKKLLRMIKNAGFIEPLVTSDGTWKSMLECGTLLDEGVIPTVNFGSNAKEHFDKLSSFSKNTPLMCMEFWCGWFSAWNQDEIIKTDPLQVAKELDEILKRGSVNFYMFHGGTNFGFNGGANQSEENGYTPDTTSYDYDALLDERGNITEKYKECKKIIEKYTSTPELELTTIPSREYNNAEYHGSANLIGNNGLETIFNSAPLSMEQLGYGYGYVSYETTMEFDFELSTMELQGMADRAIIFINDDKISNLFKTEKCSLEQPYIVNKGDKLSIIVENTGRVNYGQHMDLQKKGITEGVFINGHFYQFGWTMRKVSLDYKLLSNLEFNSKKTNMPQAHKYTLKIEDNQILDTYIDTKNMGKGYIFINGFNVGRFWEVGPQYKLFVPAELLKKGINDILIIETEGKMSEVSFVK